MMVSEIWSYAVDRKRGTAEMTNGNVILPFERQGNKIVPLDNNKRPFPGNRTLPEDLWLPKNQYQQACRMASAILRGKK